MAQKVHVPSKRQRNTTVKRSRTGCRTCKARHVKCDEAPGACKNCTSSGRKCDGYDLHLVGSSQAIVTFMRNIETRFDWATTSDERRCFSYFQHHSVPSLMGLADSPLWQQLVLQMSRTEPAVYHAVIMLGAIHQESEANRMLLAGENLSRTRHKFALEQSSRSFALLNKRHASRDPALYQVLLLCCLLFVISEAIWGRYDSAITHLRGGLKILQELKASQLEMNVEPYLVAAFIRLNTVSSQLTGGPLSDIKHNELPGQSYNTPVRTLKEAQRRLDTLLTTGVPFLAKCWILSKGDIEEDYESLSLTQFGLLSRYHQLLHQFEQFTKRSYTLLSEKQQREADLVRLHCLAQILPLKTCLLKGPIPELFTPDYVTLLMATEELIDKLPMLTTITVDEGIIPGLFVIASSCPDYRVRLQAIDCMLSWPHCEGLLNSNLAASIALEGLKGDLARKRDKECDQGVLEVADREQGSFLLNTLTSVESIADWVPIRTTRIAVPKAKARN